MTVWLLIYPTDLKSLIKENQSLVNENRINKERQIKHLKTKRRLLYNKLLELEFYI